MKSFREVHARPIESRGWIRPLAGPPGAPGARLRFLEAVLALHPGQTLAREELCRLQLDQAPAARCAAPEGIGS